ncbi:LytTR family DNA-binding domain-containing protein [candidate division KSB1 bacterium]|nr:LytTR family DNA-binding domain-containing protein [candidate division KSB1 bacterium]
MMDKIRTLIVDDEPPARRRICELIENVSDVEIVGESTNGADAIKAIHEKKPDLVFLDVQMPEADGFDVLETVTAEKMPVTVFVTAYDRYALKAFEVNALDYLLKPYSDERFVIALERARVHLQTQKRDELGAKMLALLQDYNHDQASRRQNGQAPEASSRLDRLVIKSGGRVFFLKTEEIDWIEGAGVYAKLHAGGKTHLYRETVGGLAAQLDPERFVRIHRSNLVNIDRIKELQPYSHGEYIIILKDETRLKLSRSYRPMLQMRLGQSL